ncbi:MAG: hypothetical protein Harvfovirus5_32 [Harvfovirus sp.]|uniref:Uncharacterized protein n=1 Tax=Harvfovirus sp. TaxID=2487768 RepID=A0A3G5A0L2_9VIRU|nr:MAG: hypothetical protein Harvfovirus5_32 [Harvfovirus sp.]
MSDPGVFEELKGKERRQEISAAVKILRHQRKIEANQQIIAGKAVWSSHDSIKQCCGTTDVQIVVWSKKKEMKMTQVKLFALSKCDLDPNDDGYEVRYSYLIGEFDPKSIASMGMEGIDEVHNITTVIAQLQSLSKYAKDEEFIKWIDGNLSKKASV